ncbi:hypothetical protein B484DRAFT_403884, partial [Ochromonadaceae sp. CCMP2298]
FGKHSHPSAPHGTQGTQHFYIKQRCGPQSLIIPHETKGGREGGRERSIPDLLTHRPTLIVSAQLTSAIASSHSGHPVARFNSTAVDNLQHRAHTRHGNKSFAHCDARSSSYYAREQAPSCSIDTAMARPAVGMQQAQLVLRNYSQLSNSSKTLLQGTPQLRSQRRGGFYCTSDFSSGSMREHRPLVYLTTGDSAAPLNHPPNLQLRLFLGAFYSYGPL